jgi:hypothetical protein
MEIVVEMHCSITVVNVIMIYPMIALKIVMVNGVEMLLGMFVKIVSREIQDIAYPLGWIASGIVMEEQ